MADKSIAIPVGICEDVPIVVANVTILTDFVILDILEDDSMSIILGSPFLNTAGAVITHKYRGSQQFSRVEYSTQIYWFDTRGAKEYSEVLAAELSIQPHVET